MWIQDVRHALRMMERAPGFTAAAVATFALGLGLNSAVLSLAYALFLKPLPVAEPSQVVLVDQTLPDRPARAYELSLPDYFYYREHAKTFDDLAAQYATAPLHVATTDEGFDVIGAVATASYFNVLRLQPAAGRFFTAEDDQVPDRNPVAVLSYNVWRNRFGGDGQVIGTEVRINGTSFTVIGVAPEGFAGVLRGVAPTDVWIPTAMFRVGYRFCNGFARNCRVVGLVGRLKADATIEDAQTEMSVLARQLEAAFPDTNKGRGVRLYPARGSRVNEQAQQGPVVSLLGGAAALVLLVASANVAGLLLARGLRRRKEIAIRLAVGAGRGRLIRQLLAESMVLAVAGAVAGVLVALWSTELLRTFFGMSYSGDPLNVDFSLDLRIVAAVIAIALVTGIVTGVAPALQATRPDRLTALKDEAFGTSSSRSGLREGLIALQVAVSVLLLASSGLLVRSFLALRQGPGFDPDAVVHMRLRPSLIGYSAERAWAFHRNVIQALEALPGVIAASPANVPPLPGWATTPMPIQLAGDTGDPERAFHIETTNVGPRYFESLGVDLVHGREFDDRDQKSRPCVAIVNETAARHLWPQGGAVGSVVTLSGKPCEIIGVARDAQFLNALAKPTPMGYLSFWQQDTANPVSHDSRTQVRVQGDAAAMIPQMRQVIAAIEPDVPVTEVMQFGIRLDYAFADLRATRTLLLTFGTLTLVLSAIGLYAALAFAVGQRTREIAIRIALGATRSDVGRLVFQRGGAIVTIGVVIGLIAALLSGPLLAHMLYGVSPRDPFALLAGPLILGAVALLAIWLPARRAMAMDPMTALRLE
jgi:predicted permease